MQYGGSDCCLTQNEQFFSYIMARTSNIQWDGDIRFVLYQYTNNAYIISWNFIVLAHRSNSLGDKLSGWEQIPGLSRLRLINLVEIWLLKLFSTLCRKYLWESNLNEIRAVYKISGGPMAWGQQKFPDHKFWPVEYLFISHFNHFFHWHAEWSVLYLFIYHPYLKISTNNANEKNWNHQYWMLREGKLCSTAPVRCHSWLDIVYF